MRKLIIIIILMFGLFGSSSGQQISHIMERNGWYRLFDQNGKYYTTVSMNEGQMVTYTSNYFILYRNGWYILYNSQGRKYKTMDANILGEIVASTSVGFTTERNGWLYTFDIQGNKINTRSVNE